MAEHRKQTDHEMAFSFIDNSNIFIEGKKLYARKLRLKTQEDPCFRIDIGVLMKTLLCGRKMVYGKLYGSEPPALDTVWNAIRSQKLEVDVYHRNKKKKEKEVDNALIAEAVDYAADHIGERATTTFIILAGDRDYCPLLRILLNKQWRVEVASFSQALAGSIRDLKEKYDGLTIVNRDKLLSCSFVNRRWNPLLKDKRPRTIPVHLTVAFGFKKEFNLQWKVDRTSLLELANKLTYIVKFFCRYDCREDSKHTVLIIFHISPSTHSKFEYKQLDIQKIEQECKAIFQRFEFDKIEPFVDYLQRKHQKSAPETPYTSRYSLLENETEDESSEEGSVDLDFENREALHADVASPSGQSDASGFPELNSSNFESVEYLKSDDDEFQVVEKKKYSAE